MFRLENRSCCIVPSSNTWLYTFSYIAQTRINLWLYQHGWKIIYFIVSFNFKSYIYIKYVPESPTLKLYYILSILFLQIVKIRNYEHKNFLNFLG